jgi:sugar (pentulose or hexulose) kinase
MNQDVIAVFDIGKTNKKILLFDSGLKLVLQKEERFAECPDEDGFPCDDIVKIEDWIMKMIRQFARSRKYNLRAVNFATYGASLVYLDSNGRRLTPVYNYLKSMPEDVLAGFYERYGGIEEFCRSTASPFLGMLNSGMQILWLKKHKPDSFSNVCYIVHFPQYLSFLISREARSEYTSIGCHTAMWDFDHHCYHKWLADEGIILPAPSSNDEMIKVNIYGKEIHTGTGIHDSSSSLVPYLKESPEPFILISTGTWCIFMNPFNKEALTINQLQQDTLCYLSTNQNQVKSSRYFMGHIHDIYTQQITSFFNQNAESYKQIQGDESLLNKLLEETLFFTKDQCNGNNYPKLDLSVFGSFEEAYHKLIIDLTMMGIKSLQLVIPDHDNTRRIYITGGFARNELFIRLLAALLPNMPVYISEIDNATALGAAMVLWKRTFSGNEPEVDLGLKKIEPFKINIR